jgi:mono/diheme cytochrome c family protein|tara:strand:+ start:4030 stop:5316 length:1287 start_codon:yes stop_codon:yes gene_type:complete
MSKTYLPNRGFKLATIFFLGIILATTAFSQEDVQKDVIDPAIIAAGEKLYNSNCTQCHAINEVVIGPALKGIEERRERPWLLSWIKNSQKVIESGDEYAVALYEEYKKTAMPSYPFTDAEIISVLEYIDVASKVVPQVAAVVGVGGDTVAGGGNEGVSNTFMYAILIVFIFILGLILVVLGLIISLLTKYIGGNKEVSNVDKGLVADQEVDVFSFLKSNTVLGMIIFVFVAVGLKTGIDGLFTIGVQQGYMPTQPIAYSHELHAGQYEIDCNYCHTGVRKSKSANIPSANICMNCHVAIKTESKEIQKIYAAIDYDPETGEYGEDIQPIEWVRVHNLPDLAYFNHSQHVKVGGLECETCHGPIKEMEVVYQYSNLTMGWCINCHRETNVKSKGNDYYTNLVELHNEKNTKEPMKVEDIGGLECSKCHY